MRCISAVVVVVAMGCGGDGAHHLAPDTVLDQTPPALTNQTHAAFAFHAEPPTTTDFTCTIDGTSQDCTSPFAIDLTDGMHHFGVRATDAATDTTFDWTIDTMAPDTAITSAPPPLDNTPTESVAFAGTDGAVAFECALDGAAFAACTSPASLTPGDGQHAFAVRAIDGAGNADPTPAMATWTLDTTLPDTMITAGPDAASTSGPAVQFAFTSPVGNATFECALDGAAFAACTTPLSLAALTDGAHAFAVRAKDDNGVVDPSPATRSWTVDATAPPVSIDAHPVDPTDDNTPTFAFSSTDATATFSCAFDADALAPCASPLTGGPVSDGSHTFTVVATDPFGNASAPASFTWLTDTVAPVAQITSGPSGAIATNTAIYTFTTSGAPVSVACSVDASAFAACTSPFTSAVLADGAHGFVVQAIDAAGNIGSDSRSFTVDTTAPAVAITVPAPSPTSNKTPSIGFTAGDAVAIACKVDAGGFTACTSPFTTPTLADGSHTVTVRGTDAVGNAATASDTFVVDTSAPTVTITSKPTNPTNVATATFAFTASDGALQCKLDGGAFATCASPLATGTLADGSHTFTVQATDTANNTGSASFTWTIDTQAPTVTITSTPANPSNSSGATFGFAVSDGTVQCRVDTGAFAACASPKAYTGLADGSHTLTVNETDTAGNTGTASFTWTIDTVAPTVAFTTTPANPSKSASATFAFSTSEPATTQCQLDGGAFAACTSPDALAGLADGSHTLTVNETDTAGNTGTATSFTWVVDTTAPTVAFTTTPANPSKSASATFAFSTSEPATTQCQLDGGGFVACTSPDALAGLADGSHTFAVKATDTAGNAGTATSFTWVVDTTPPTVTFTSTPTNPSNSASASFAFSTSETATTQCSLDGGAFNACTSPKTLAGLADGSHTFAVRATDTAGNTGTATSFTWTVDTTAPTVTFTTTPANPSNSASASFAFSVSETGTTQQCSLDGGAFAACTSPRALAGLADGSHTFQAKATDAAGNTGTPASFTWTVDTTAPTVTFTRTPANPSNSASASFAFTVSETGTTQQCSLDGGAFAACTSPKTLAALADGSHTFQVKATDAAGNAGTPASFTWTVDTTAPTVTFTSTPANPTNATAATFAFTVSETGTTQQCQLDGGGFAACASPKTLTALAQGSHTFQVKATDGAGNTGTAASFTWTVDTTPPTVTFTSTPANPTNATSATFAFSVSETGTTQQCSLDGGTFAACTSPKALTALADGSHTFQVKATDGAGNTGTPASFTWTIDTVAPTVTFTATPANPTNSTSATFAFTVSETGTTQQCSLDGGAFAACTSPKTLAGLAQGSHTFQVKATDAAGNTGTAASFTWTVDTTAPTVTFTSTPANPTNATAATFAFTISETGTTQQCSLDGGAFAACASPKTVAGLAQGSHTFQVKATDAAGNTGAAASFTWTVDTTPPTVTFTSTPANPSNSASATFAFTVSETGTTQQCSIDGGAFAACTSPRTLAGLADGSHTFAVKATDAAGNTGTAASFTWTIDTVAPTVTFTSTPANPTNSASATFAFTVSETGTTQQCQIDGGTFAACTSPKALTSLADGSHTFQVKATDAAGNTGTAASFTWTVDTTPPTVTFTGKPSNPSNSSSATFSFTVSDGTITCQIDGGAFTACTSPKTFSTLADGSHTFVVHATDTAGNVGSASFTWTIDTTPPVLVLDDTPPATWPVNYYDMLFHSPESGVTFTCSLNGGAFTACTSPFTITTTYGITSTFTVKAADALGNSTSQSATPWTSTAGLVLHYPWEQGATHNTSLLKQKPAYSPDGTVTLTPHGGWAGTSAASPAAHTYKGSLRPLTSSANSSYTASVWVLPTPNGNGTIWTNQSSTAGIKLTIGGTNVTLSVLQNGTQFTATGALTPNAWNNIAVTSTSPDKGVNLFINGAASGVALPPTKIGFDPDATDVTVGPLTTVDIDDLRFENIAETGTTMCTNVVRGFFDANGSCHANRPNIHLRFDDNVPDEAGDASAITVSTPGKFTTFADKQGFGLEVDSTDSITTGFALANFTKNLDPTVAHTLALWFDSGTAFPSDTLMDFTTACNPLTGLGVCGIQIKWDASKGNVVVVAGAINGTTVTSGQAVVPVTAAGFHSVLVVETKSTGTTTKQLQVYIDGTTNTTTNIIAIGSGNVYGTVSDRVILPHAAGTRVDEIQMYPADLSVAADELCENGFDGEFDVVTGTCLLTSN